MHTSIYVLDITALFYLMWILHSSAALNIYRKKPFMLGIILTILVILSEAGTIVADNENFNLRNINILCNVLGFAITPMISLALTLVFDVNFFKSNKLLLMPSLVNATATVLSPIYKFIFYVDVDNNYFRGDYFFIFILVYIINFLVFVFRTLEVGKIYNYPIKGKLVVLSLFTVIGTSIQLKNPHIYSTWHCVTLSLLLYFILLSEFDSSFDSLTGFYNRAAFEKTAKLLEGEKAFSIIILDINDFKKVNDTYGHDYGDTVLKSIAEVIKKSFNNKHYTCYRFGGDEFSIISSEKEEEQIEFHLRNMIKNFEELREKGIHLPTVSYGYSIFSGENKLDFNKILKEADEQMYRYKTVHKTNQL